jgi:hypothetical protein
LPETPKEKTTEETDSTLGVGGHDLVQLVARFEGVLESGDESRPSKFF